MTTPTTVTRDDLGTPRVIPWCRRWGVYSGGLPGCAVAPGAGWGGGGARRGGCPPRTRPGAGWAGRRRLEKEARPGRCGEGPAAACASGWAGRRAAEREGEAGPGVAGARPAAAGGRRARRGSAEGQPPRAHGAGRPTAGPSWARRARARGRGTGDSGGGVRGGAGPDAPPLGSARRSPARSPRPAAARPGPRSAVEEPPEEPGARARRPPDMVGHLHLQGMEESLKEKSREGLLDSPDSGLPPSPSPSPPFYSLAPGILDARAGGSGASSEAPGPGEAKAVSTRLRAETGNRASPPDGVLQEPGLGSPPIPPAKKVAK